MRLGALSMVAALALSSGISSASVYFLEAENFDASSSVTTYDENSFLGNTMIAYRLQNSNGFLFRCGLNLMYRIYDEHCVFDNSLLILPLPLISFGKWF